MLLLILFTLLLILSILISPLLLCGLGKIFNIKDLTFKKALLTSLLLLLITAVSEIITLVFTLLNVDNIIFNLILSIALIVLNIYIFKVKFETTVLKSIGLYISLIVIAVGSALLIRTNIVQAYKIPSGALKPTLVIGDHLLVNKFIYDYKEPSRGDLIVFPFPEDPSKIYIKRIIGVEGDKIEIKNDVLFLNDNEVQLSKVGDYNDDKISGADEYIETLEGSSYHILDIHEKNDNFGPIVVPENSLFVLGDNRDNSMDSRYWGFVDKTTVKGKAFVIYWSWDSNKSQVRWERIGNSL